MTHVDTKAMERFPTTATTLGINSRHHAGNTAESQTGPQMHDVCTSPYNLRLQSPPKMQVDGNVAHILEGASFRIQAVKHERRAQRSCRENNSI